MNGCDPYSTYQVASWLAFPTEESQVRHHRVSAPGQAVSERLVAKKLGSNGWKRWQYFLNNFSGRWGDEGQQPVSPRSRESMLRALEMLEFPPATRPSLFLTDNGYFEVAWNDLDGKAVQIEFGPNEFEIYVESSGIEGTYPNSEMSAVIPRHITGS